MLPSPYYNIIDAIVYLIAAIIPAYFILKSRNSINNNDNPLRKLTIILIGFILLQVLYHVIGTFGFRLLAKGFLEPLSMAALLLFGIMYLLSTLKTKKQQQQQEFKT
jgi:cytochrome bd-type quinol oxidase subunit 2